MNYIKKIILKKTGYYLHKASTLPAGTHLVVNLENHFGITELPVIFDVGANTGQSWMFFRELYAGSNIYCFEPVKDTYKLLCKNVVHDSRVITENMALGREIGEVQISLFDEMNLLNSLRPELMNNNPSARKETVRVIPLDDYCIKNDIGFIDLLKIDTEGFELEVLMGASNMLKEKKIKMIYAECGFENANRRNTALQDLINFLSPLNYYFYGIYQLLGDGWNKGEYLGNALFVDNCVQMK